MSLDNVHPYTGPTVLVEPRFIVEPRARAAFRGEDMHQVTQHDAEYAELPKRTVNVGLQTTSGRDELDLSLDAELLMEQRTKYTEGARGELERAPTPWHHAVVLHAQSQEPQCLLLNIAYVSPYATTGHLGSRTNLN